MKAFTELSSELSRAPPTAAMAVTPALAAVITSHAKTKDRVEDGIRELELLWKTLFTTLEDDISKVVDTRLQDAIATLHKERDDILQAMTRCTSRKGDEPRGETPISHVPIDNWRELAPEGTMSFSERSAVSIDVVPVPSGSSGQKLRRIASPSPSLVVPKQEEDGGSSLKDVLESMKFQMDRQTRAIELLAKENQQVRIQRAERLALG
ncbi:hypothetical protein HYDPIDRAFT_106058 [Hydnomerulius pinastri MD-312]|nr:hypothetical protein HYDPIDRAFT_106058 [Hydnomerulius pinastri MD-312]